ncbi:uncharacterized protein LOC126882637 [Diabrotica virgifera virgifera]|uniref:MADF domain-containing protein n=1 Tax=Diabrotica virgifera virgifera TaxID=50390 RepID=A0ABM5K054_DIAVI|nr:uncharacterized protein LOC126882637 [Diabrotica virgifera virgifera]
MERIIELVRKYPILYDLSHEDYKNVRKKDKIWTRIGEEIGENGDEIKKKWRNMRDTYAKYIRTNKTRTGQAASDKKKWIWADHMESFKPFLNFAKTASNVTDVDTQESEAFPNIESPENILTDENSAVQKPTCSKNLLTTQTYDSQNKIQPSSSKPTRNEAPRVTLSNETPSTGRTNRKRNSEPSTYVKDMISYFESKKRVVHDATDQLFLAHASTVKSFSPRRQIETKMKIAQVIMEQELLQLEESSLNSHLSRAESTDTYQNPSSVGSISVVSLPSPNDTALPKQSNTSGFYEVNCENNYITLDNLAQSCNQAASHNPSVSNYVNSFDPYNT